MGKGNARPKRGALVTPQDRDWQVPNRPLFLGLDGLAGFILALLLWELRMTPYTYTAVGIALAIAICAFISLLIPSKIAHANSLRAGVCVIAMLLLGSVLIPDGIYRFPENKPSSAPISDRTSSATNNGAMSNNQSGGFNGTQSGNITNYNAPVTMAAPSATPWWVSLANSLREDLADKTLSPETREIIQRKIDLLPFVAQYMSLTGRSISDNGMKSPEAIKFYNQHLQEAGKTWRITSDNVDSLFGLLILNSHFVGNGGGVGIQIRGGSGNVFDQTEIKGVGTGIDLQDTTKNEFYNTTIVPGHK